jgi:hypothetical protein
MTTKNFKRVYVMTNHKIDPVLNGVICNWMIAKHSHISEYNDHSELRIVALCRNLLMYDQVLPHHSHIGFVDDWRVVFIYLCVYLRFYAISLINRILSFFRKLWI